MNCTGLGARELCNDKRMVSLRGQLIKVRYRLPLVHVSNVSNYPYVCTVRVGKGTVDQDVLLRRARHLRHTRFRRGSRPGWIAELRFREYETVSARVSGDSREVQRAGAVVEERQGRATGGRASATPGE